MQEQVNELVSNLKASWRYRWYALLSAWLIALGGWVAVYIMPERYESSARIYVDTKSVLRHLLHGLVVQPNMDEAVAMMSQTLINRPNLEKVITVAGLDVGLNSAEDRDELIARLRRELSIRGAGGPNYYTIAYTDKDPHQAERVVRSLVTIFVEGSLNSQRADSEAARRFIDEQLKSHEEKLVAAENAVTEFRRRHMGLTAGDRRDYYTRLMEAQVALNGATLELKEAENSRDAIKTQLAADTEIPFLLDDKSGDVGGPSEIDLRVHALEQKLDNLRLSYTEQHPDVVAMVRTIAQLREQKQAEAKLRKPSARAAQTRQTQNPVQQQLTVALASAEANVAARKARVAEYERRYSELKAAVNAVPQVDAEYTQLTRDYEVTKKNYADLLARRESAKISGEMEANASVTDFRVVDPPRVPTAPKRPSRGLLMSLVLLVALGGGMGIAFSMSQIRPTFSDEHRLRKVSGLSVLGTVGMAWGDAQKARRRRGLFAFLLSFSALLGAYTAIMAALMLTVAKA
jgi:polysaccharide chain length determinant protein (PEP-CTERM system associated)